MAFLALKITEGDVYLSGEKMKRGVYLTYIQTKLLKEQYFYHKKIWKERHFKHKNNYGKSGIFSIII